MTQARDLRFFSTADFAIGAHLADMFPHKHVETVVLMSRVKGTKQYRKA